MRLITTTLSALCLGAVAAAQTGSDDCTTPDIIVGSGTYSYDTTLATDSLIPVSCSVSGTYTNLNLDVWFEWTADFTGIAVFSLCSGGGHDSKIAVWPSTPGACPLPGTEVACDDDGCGAAQGYTSETTFAVTSGTSYLLGIGCYTTETGTGTFTILEDAPIQNPANGHYYYLVRSNDDWYAAKVGAEALTYQGMQGHLVTIADQAENDFVISLGTVDFFWLGGFQNTSSPTYAEPDGGWEWVTGEPFVYDNWTTGEPNNAGAMGAEDHIEIFGGGTWNDIWYAERPTGYIVEFDTSSGQPFCLGDGTEPVPCPCGNDSPSPGEGCLNGTGLGAYITASGNSSVSNDTLVLTVNQAAPVDFGIFVQNITTQASPVPFYNGLFCLNADSHLVRHYAPPAVQPTVTDASGTGDNAQPMTVGDYLNDTQPGTTIYYQFWGRDNTGPCGAGANFSSGLAVNWLP